MRTLEELIMAAFERKCRDFVVSKKEAALLKMEAPKEYWYLSPERRDPIFLGCYLVDGDAADAARAHEQDMRRG